MSTHLEREIERLKRKILSQSALAEDSVRRAMRALAERDAEAARHVIEVDDRETNELEVDIEEDCLKVLALHQPVAIDLRFIISVLKINADLERVADLAVNIAERALFLSEQDPLGLPIYFDEMAQKAQAMLKNALDALVNMDSDLAREVCAADDEVDDINRQMYARIQAAILEHPSRVDGLMHLLAVSRHLERIADHATNIAEDVVYMVDGEIVRHRSTDFTSQT
jgi:phosphate transport system protein